LGQQADDSHPVLKKGSYVLEGTVVKGIPMSHIFRAQAGQRLTLSIEAEKGKATFNLLVGGRATQKEAAYADDAVDVEKWSEKLRRTGEYQVLSRSEKVL
jgi:hypothetical protein